MIMNMNGTFKTPEVFKLTFLPNNQIIDIESIFHMD